MPRSPHPPRAGFTIVELLVVVAIIGALVGLLLPAVQSAREAARRSQCGNNVRQLAVAVHNYQSARSAFPPSMVHTPGTTFTSNNGSWSIHGRVLPYLEEAVVAAKVSLETAWDEGFDPEDLTKNWGLVKDARIGPFFCPSEPNLVFRTKSRSGAEVPYVFPHTYGFNFGTWFVYDPATGQGGDGAFRPNARLTPAKFSDGLSKTLCIAEVKAFTPYVRNTNDPSGNYPAESPPSDAAAVVALATGMSASNTKLGPSLNDNTGHTEWPDGRVHHSGFTTTLAPNTRVAYPSGSATYDFDVNSRQEGSSATAKTFAAITSRSHHRGMVTVAMMDGSTATIANGIAAGVWRALSTRGSGEVEQLP